MTDSDKSAPRRGFDVLGVVLLGVLALGGIGAGVALVQQGEFTASGLVLALLIGGAFVAAHHGLPKPAPPKNTHVHGAGRPANEQEAQRAARGEAHGPRLDDREF